MNNNITEFLLILLNAIIFAIDIYRFDITIPYPYLWIPLFIRKHLIYWHLKQHWRRLRL